MHKVAIVGSGPSGMFLAKNLIKLFKNKIEIDIFEKNSTPLGLLKFGVAPDHPEVKRKYMSHFDSVFHSKNVSIYLDAKIGIVPSISELSRYYDALAMCTGMSDSLRSWEPSEQNCGADEIFGWYNANPNYSNLRPDISKVNHLVIVGNGNVALDMVRIFSKKPSQFSNDSLDSKVLKVLSKSNITDITVLGRRDITKASFTPAELRELKLLCNHCKISVFPEINVEDEKNLSRIQMKNLHIMKDLVNSSMYSNLEKRITFKFNSVVEGVSKKNGFGMLKILNNSTGNLEIINFDLMVECIGFKQNQNFGHRMQDDNGKFITTDRYRVKDNIYACGWSRTGPKGNIADSLEEAGNCASKIYEDLIASARTRLDFTLDRTIFAHRFSK